MSDKLAEEEHLFLFVLDSGSIIPCSLKVGELGISEAFGTHSALELFLNTYAIIIIQERFFAVTENCYILKHYQNVTSFEPKKTLNVCTNFSISG